MFSLTVVLSPWVSEFSHPARPSHARVPPKNGLTILWTNQGQVRWFFPMANLTIVLLFWSEEEVKKGSNIAWTLTLPSTSCISEEFRDMLELISLILPSKDNVLWPTGLHRVHLWRRKCEWKTFNDQTWIDSMRKVSKGQGNPCFFTAPNPMDDDQSVGEIRCDLDKPRISPYKNAWRPHQIRFSPWSQPSQTIFFELVITN